MTATRVKLIHRYGVVDAYLPDGRIIGEMRRVTKSEGATWTGWLYEIYGTGDGDGLDGATKAEALADFLRALDGGARYLRAYRDEDLFPEYNLNKKASV